MLRLSDAQLAILRMSVQADPVLNVLPAGPDSAYTIASKYNDAANPPNNICFKTSVSNESIGDAMNGAEVAEMSSVDMQRAQMLSDYSDGKQNPSRADRREAFALIFSGPKGANTRAALNVLWRRTMTRCERLFATGTGSTETPAILTFEGFISYMDVMSAMKWE